MAEGAWPGAVVLMEFPNRDAAEKWYNSAEYARIRPLRWNSAISDVVLVDQVPDGYTVKGFAQQIRALKAANSAS